MSVLLDTPVVAEVDERAARATLRAQIARLERGGRTAPGTGAGPRLLGLGELEAVRDALVLEFAPQSETGSAITLLERMFADPAAHRHCSVSLADLGRPGCGSYRVKPRLGLIGMLAGWWHVVVSSGCP
jgi:hypothetical protein